MRRYIVFGCLFLFVCNLLQAQVNRGLKGKYNTDNYPEVSFVWNTPNPDVLTKSMFTLEDENGNNIDFQIQNLQKGNISGKKNILFLWEDMRSHDQQSENTKKFLTDFFNGLPSNSSTEFNIATFNRKSDNKNVLFPLLSGFTSNTSQLAAATKQYVTSKRFYNTHPKSSDLYLAINEGIEMLKKQPSDRVGVIVVVTAGLNVKASGASTEMETVRQKALQAGIPIYVVKYKIAGNTPEVNTLAESTYGLTMFLENRKTNEAVSGLQNWYKNLDNRLYGQDYKFTFTSSVKRDGKPHVIKLNVNKVSADIPPFTAPDMTLSAWVKDNVLLFILIVVLIIAVIAVGTYFIINAIKKQKQNIQDMEDRHNREILDAKDEMERQKRDQDAKLNAYKQQVEEEERRKQREEEGQRLLHIMQAKNLFPRLQCTVDGNTTAFTIGNVETRIGRNQNNDVVISNQTVSGYHAKIRFNGASFEIENKSKTYSQGLIVNGQLFQTTTLKSGDKIGLGEAVLTFYV